MQIQLKDVDNSNWRAVIKLSVRDDQRHFVADNASSLVQSIFDDNLKGKVITQGIYDGDTLIGFTMYGSDADDPADELGTMWIVRFMIGAEFQGKGYGRAALDYLINYARNQSDIRTIRLSYEPQNIAAKKLYASAGFVEEGMNEDWGEMVVALKLVHNG